MAGSRRLCVVDSNILIDLHLGGLLPEFFRLPLVLVAPDVIIEELEHPDGNELERSGLQRRELSGEEVQEVAALATQYRGVSAKDLFALVLARSLGATLLSGDGQLRRIATARGLSVHGTLWVLDEMIRLNVAQPSRAGTALERMLAGGSRLPEVECRRRLERWGAR